VFLSEKPYHVSDTSQMYRNFTIKMVNSEPTDWLAPTGFTVMSMIAAAIFAVKHKRLNLLIHVGGAENQYIPREVVIAGQGGKKDGNSRLVGGEKDKPTIVR